MSTKQASIDLVADLGSLTEPIFVDEQETSKPAGRTKNGRNAKYNVKNLSEKEKRQQERERRAAKAKENAVICCRQCGNGDWPCPPVKGHLHCRHSFQSAVANGMTATSIKGINSADDAWFRVNVHGKKVYFCDEACYKEWNANGRPGEVDLMAPHVRKVHVERVVLPAARRAAEIELEDKQCKKIEAVLAPYDLHMQPSWVKARLAAEEAERAAQAEDGPMADWGTA